MAFQASIADELSAFLFDFVSSLDNIPSELSFLLVELRNQDAAYQSILKRIQHNDAELDRGYKGAWRNEPISSPGFDTRRNQIIASIHEDFAAAAKVADEKAATAAKAAELINKHIVRLDGEMKRLNEEYGDVFEDHYGLDGYGISHIETREEKKYDRTYSFKKKSTTLSASQLDGNQVYEEIVDDAGDDTPYCYCRNVSYGEMVGCDGDNCQYGGWFHMSCTGLKALPRGSWYCDSCRR